MLTRFVQRIPLLAQDFKRKFLNLNAEIRTLREQIDDKAEGSVKQMVALESVNMDIDLLKVGRVRLILISLLFHLFIAKLLLDFLQKQNGTMKEHLEEMEDIIKNKTKQIRKLSTIIADADGTAPVISTKC